MNQRELQIAFSNLYQHCSEDMDQYGRPTLGMIGTSSKFHVTRHPYRDGAQIYWLEDDLSLIMRFNVVWQGGRFCLSRIVGDHTPARYAVKGSAASLVEARLRDLI